MKKLLLASAALAFLAAPSFASDTATFTLTGNVTAVCSVSPTALTIPLGNIPLNTDGTVLGTPITVGPVGGEIWCNGNNNTMTVTANPLMSTDHPDGVDGFDTIINYKLVDLDGLPGSVTTAVGGITVSSTSADPIDLAGNANGTVTPIAGGKVVAGGYTGTVVITLTPGP